VASAGLAWLPTGGSPGMAIATPDGAVWVCVGVPMVVAYGRTPQVGTESGGRLDVVAAAGPDIGFSNIRSNDGVGEIEALPQEIREALIADEGRFYKIDKAQVPDWDGEDPGCGHPLITMLCVEGKCGGAVESVESVEIVTERDGDEGAVEGDADGVESVACRQCGVVKPRDAEHFSRDRKAKSGFRSGCKVCQAAGDANRTRSGRKAW
jgi:hypothetical protein